MKRSSRRRLFAIAWLTLLVDLPLAHAGAEESSDRVLVIVEGAGGDPEEGVLDRVVAEVQSIGLDVVVGEPESRGRSLSALAAEHGTRRALRVIHHAPRVRIETSRRVDGREERAVREVEVRGESTYGTAALIAFKVAEEIQARWALDVPASSPRAEPSSAERGTVTSLPRRRLRWSGFLGSGLLCSRGGIPCSVHARVGVNLAYGRFALGLAGGPAYALDAVTTEAGSARLFPHTAEAQAAFSIEGRSMGLRIGAGLMVVAARLHAEAAPGYESESSFAASFAPLVRLSARWIATPHVAPTLELLGGTAFPRTRLRFAGENVARWGSVFAMLAVGIEWSPSG